MITFIAHRGRLEKKDIGNTLEDFKKSGSSFSIAGVELDVRMTKDHKLIVFHDFLITDFNNILRPVSDFTLSEIRKVDLAKGKSVRRIPTLTEVLDVLPVGKKILIELKEEKHAKLFLKYLYRIIQKYPELTIYICSFHVHLLHMFHAKYPNYKIGVIASPLLNHDVPLSSFDFAMLSYSLLDHWDFSCETFVWTINTKEKLEKIKEKDSNVTVITDDPLFLNRFL